MIKLTSSKLSPVCYSFYAFQSFDLFAAVNSQIIVNLFVAKDIHLSTQEGIFSQYSLSLRPMDLEVLEVDLMSN